MSEEKPRLSRRELRERGLLAPITEGPSPLEERRRQQAMGNPSSRRATGMEEIAERESEQSRRSVFERFDSDDDETPAEVFESSVVTPTKSESLEERLLARVREGDFSSAEGTGVVSTPGESRAVEVADAVVGADIIATEYDLDELAEPKKHRILLILLFILGGLAIGLFIGFGYRTLGSYPAGEFSPKFSVAVLQTVDSLQEENSVSI